MMHHRTAHKIVMVLIVLGILFCIGGIFTSWVIQEEDELANNPKIESQIIDAFNEKTNVEVIVMLKESEGREIQSDILMENPKFKVKYQYSIINAFAGELDKETLEQLADNPQVEKIYLNKIYKINLDESAVLINADDVNRAKLNNINLTGKYQSACVVDTGVNYNHPALDGRVILGWDYVNNDSDPMDDNSHGTHVAGIIASDDSVYTGVAPEANIVAVKVCGSGGSCAGEDVIAGIEWCIDNASQYNISVISMSLGDGVYNNSNCPTDFDSVINSAVANNIIVVVSSGNNLASNGISVPACSPNATSVASTYKTDSIWTGGNTGTNLDLLAPGVSIYSSVLGNNFESKTGTSMAAPHVSGTALLLYQHYNLRSQSITPNQIENKLKATGKNITDLRNGLNFPRVNAEDAVLMARLTASHNAGAYPRTNNNITFYGNYTNRTNNNSISTGNCYLTLSGSVYGMTYNATAAAYQFIKNFTTAATYTYSVQCNQSSFETITDEESIEVVEESLDCTYPGSNINWNLTGTDYSRCVAENLTINQSNINVKDNAEFVLKSTNLTLVGASSIYVINTTGESNFTVYNSLIKGIDTTTKRLDVEIFGYGDIYNSTFENSKFIISGNKTHEIFNNTFKYYSYFGDNSTNQVNKSNFTNYAYFEDSSLNQIKESNFSGRVYFGKISSSDNPVINVDGSTFKGDYLIIAASAKVNFTELSNVNSTLWLQNSPTIYGHVNMPGTVTMLSDNTTRYYPVYIYYHGTTTPYPNKQVNITDSEGNLIWQGLTNAQGYVEPDLLLNTTNYGSGNFTISVNESKDINLLTDTPITLESATLPPVGNSGNGGTTPCDENWSCTEWEICINGIQIRTCSDLENCGTETDKPNETQECISNGNGEDNDNHDRILRINEVFNEAGKDCCLFGICWFRYIICWYWWILIAIILIIIIVSYWRMKRKKRKKIQSAMIDAVGAEWVVQKFKME